MSGAALLALAAALCFAIALILTQYGLRTVPSWRSPLYTIGSCMIAAWLASAVFVDFQHHALAVGAEGEKAVHARLQIEVDDRVRRGVIDGKVRVLVVSGLGLAPFAVACLLFSNTASFGIDLLGALVWYMVTVLAGLALHLFGVYSASVAFLSRISPVEFFRRTKTVMLTAFATSSSNETLPTALRVGEESLGIPREINSFVLTVGATANQNGTALYEGVTVLFLAQLAGVDLSIGQQIVVAYMAILGGIGTAGVPSGSIPFIVVVLATVGVNPALIAIILGVDRVLDMCRTTLNVVGDLTAATYVARSEGHALLAGRD